MRKAIVLGATGGMGYALVSELVEREVQVTAFARNEDKLKRLFRELPNLDIFPGDAFVLDELDAAVKGHEVVFHAINLPYGDWKTKLPKLTKNIIHTAEKNAAKLAIVDNIYSYGRNPGVKIKETTPKKPHTKKGKIRLEMEGMYKKSGVPYTIAHFPDFYGPAVESSLLNFTLTKMVNNKKAQFVGDLSIPREYIFTLDGAKALVELAMNEKAYGQNWNIPATDLITGEEIIRIIRHYTGNQKRVGHVTKNMIRFIGLFNKQMREFVEMQYLNENPVVLDGEKYEKQIGPLPRTPYEKGIKKTIEAMVN